MYLISCEKIRKYNNTGFVEFLKKKKRAETHRASGAMVAFATCEEKLHRKFPPTEIRRSNFHQSNETRYGLFTETCTGTVIGNQTRCFRDTAFIAVF